MSCAGPTIVAKGCGGLGRHGLADPPKTEKRQGRRGPYDTAMRGYCSTARRHVLVYDGGDALWCSGLEFPVRAYAVMSRARASTVPPGLRMCFCVKGRPCGHGDAVMGFTVLGIDPGSRSHGFAFVSCSGGALRFVSGGRLVAGAGPFRDMLLSAVAAPDVVAIEQPEGYAYDKWRSADLVATSRAAGEIAGVAIERGIRVVHMTAAETRKALLGKSRLGFRQARGAMDRAVKGFLPAVVQGLPGRSNVHVRDAVAVGAVVAMRLRHELGAVAVRGSR